MLKGILRHLNDDAYFSLIRLADKLNTSPGAAEAAIQQLVRMGYIKEEKTGEACASSCGGCPSAQHCGKEIVNIYEITAKGKELIGA